MTAIHRKLYMFLQDNFHFRPQLFSLAESASLRDARVMESSDIPELVAFLKAEFKIDIATSEIVPSNFDSINGLVGYIEGKVAFHPAMSACGRF